MLLVYKCIVTVLQSEPLESQDAFTSNAVLKYQGTDGMVERKCGVSERCRVACLVSPVIAPMECKIYIFFLLDFYNKKTLVPLFNFLFFG